jgi:hypothetical protein
MRIGLALILFALCVAGAIVAHHMMTPPPAHVVLAIDHSLSVARNCGGLRKEGERLLAQPAVQQGSTVTLLGIGRSARDPEPARLFDKPVPTESDAVFGRDDSAFQREQAAFLSQLEKSCEAAEASKDSPIVRLVTQGLAHLRSRNCRADGRCFLTIATDMQEDVEPALRAAIERVARRPSTPLPPTLAGTLDNAGIEVRFCGGSELRPGAKRLRAAPETLARLWKGIFTHPELVSFQPFCGQ